MSVSGEPYGMARPLGVHAVHPLVIALVALLVALVIVSVVVFHRRAKAALAGYDALAADSDAMLTALMAEARAAR